MSNALCDGLPLAARCYYVYTKPKHRVEFVGKLVQMHEGRYSKLRLDQQIQVAPILVLPACHRTKYTWVADG